MPPLNETNIPVGAIMRKSQILTTVSVIALSAAGAVPMAAIISKPARAAITIDWSFGAPADVKVSNAAIEMASEQENINKGAIKATIDNAFIQIPLADYVGGIDTLSVVANDASATTIANTGTKSIDLFTITGADGGVSGAAQINRGLTTIDSKVDTTNIFIASEDLGAGSTQTLDLNLIASNTTGNLETSTISGDVNALLSSTAGGKAAVSQGSNKFLTASGTLMVGSMQINDIWPRSRPA